MAMFSSLLLRLTAVETAAVSPFLGRQMHALFLDIIGRLSPGLAGTLHADTPLRPFTISGLIGQSDEEQTAGRVNAGNTYYARFTFLDASISSVFRDAAGRLVREVRLLDKARFVIEGLLERSSESPLCGAVAAEQLLHSAGSARKIHLQFFSPCVFRSQGRRNVVFPLPQLVFGSWLARWQHFSSAPLDPLLANIFERVNVSRYALLTRPAGYGSYLETGFEGDCVFELPKNISDEEAGCLNALADFAFYCGTGAKTAMGMGQTRRIK
jgi:CRISPR-associated endoribonuclease Cas6